MTRSFTIRALIALLAMTGCATQEKFLNSRQDLAMQTAVTRARFEMNCPSANGEVLSREVTQPAVQGPRFVGEERGLFTIGVAGCGQRQTYEGCARWTAPAARRSKAAGGERSAFGLEARSSAEASPNSSRASERITSDRRGPR